MENGKYKYAFVGDIHADFRTLKDFLLENYWLDYVIQVGDLMLYQNLDAARTDPGYKKSEEYIKKHIEEPLNMPVPVHFIKGNHDNFEMLSSPYYRKKNFYFMGQGTIQRLGNINIGVLGGIYSSKRTYFKSKELKGKSQRFYTTEDIENLKEQNNKTPIDVLVTHEGPKGLIKGKDTREHEGSDLIVDLIDEIKPTYYIHGHHHCNYQTKRGETNVIGVGNMQTNNKSYRFITW